MSTGLERGLALLEAVVRSGKSRSFTELMVELGGLNRASLSRLLKQLLATGHLVKDQQTGRYGPGERMAIFAGTKTPGRAQWLINCLASTMTDLSIKHDCTCILQERVGTITINIHKTQTEVSANMQAVGYVNDQYDQIWMHLVAAFRGEVERRYQDDHRLHTYLSAINLIKAKKYAFDDGTLRTHFRRLGFPIFDRDGQLAGIFGLGATTTDFTDRTVANLAETVPHLIETATS